jgi:hypothetical protein
MSKNHRPITLCFVFAVLGSTLAFARPMMRSEDGCRSCEKNTAACHVPISKACAATGYACCRLPNATRDDWPAGMILGNADLMLTFRHRLNGKASIHPAEPSESPIPGGRYPGLPKRQSFYATSSSVLNEVAPYS